MTSWQHLQEGIYSQYLAYSDADYHAAYLMISEWCVYNVQHEFATQTLLRCQSNENTQKKYTEMEHFLCNRKN